jgi:hypothetical protein
MLLEPKRLLERVRLRPKGPREKSLSKAAKHHKKTVLEANPCPAILIAICIREHACVHSNRAESIPCSPYSTYGPRGLLDVPTIHVPTINLQANSIQAIPVFASVSDLQRARSATEQ